MEFKSLPLSDYQRSRILLLRDAIDEHTGVDIESSDGPGKSQGAPTADDDEVQVIEVSPPNSSSANEQLQTLALYQQLDLAKRLRHKLEASVHKATNVAQSQAAINSTDSGDVIQKSARAFLGSHREDLLQLVALTEATQSGYSLDSYDHYVEEFRPQHNSRRQAIQAVKDHVARMRQENAEIKQSQGNLQQSQNVTTFQSPRRSRPKMDRANGRATTSQSEHRSSAAAKQNAKQDPSHSEHWLISSNQTARKYPLESLPGEDLVCKYHLPERGPMEQRHRQQMENLCKELHHSNDVSCYICREKISIWHSDTIPSEKALGSVVSRSVVRMHCQTKGHRVLWEAANPWDYVPYKQFVFQPQNMGFHIVLAFTFVEGRAYLLPSIEQARAKKMKPEDILSFYLERLERTDVNVLKHVVRHIPEFVEMMKFHPNTEGAKPDAWIPPVVRFINDWIAMIGTPHSNVGSACASAVKMSAKNLQSPLKLMMSQRVSFISERALKS